MKPTPSYDRGQRVRAITAPRLAEDITCNWQAWTGDEGTIEGWFGNKAYMVRFDRHPTKGLDACYPNEIEPI